MYQIRVEMTCVQPAAGLKGGMAAFEHVKLYFTYPCGHFGGVGRDKEVDSEAGCWSIWRRTNAQVEVD